MCGGVEARRTRDRSARAKAGADLRLPRIPSAIMSIRAPGESQPEWDIEAMRDIVATEHTEAIVVTDRNGRVLDAQARRELPAELGALLEASVAAMAAAGEHFSLGEMRLAASQHDGGTLVCGRTRRHSVFILATPKANLGQLIGQARRVFPGRGSA
jgi:hypothetical protein